MKAYLGSTGIGVEGVCDECSGDGMLSDTGYHDETLIFCPHCDGKGGDNPLAVVKFRSMDQAYFKALVQDNEPSDS